MRKPIFDYVKSLLKRAYTKAEVAELDRLLTAAGVPQDAAPAPTASPAPSGAIGRMRTSPRGIALIHDFERCVLTAYPDPGTGGKPWTIGWGSTRDEQNRPIQPGTKWTRERADARFAMDLADFERDVNALLGSAPTTQNQFDALMSFAYNVGQGEGGLKTSTLLRMHKDGDYAGAAKQFARWNRSGGRVMAGLTRRRAAEAALYSEE